MKYKEKKLTKEQLRRIEIIRKQIEWLRENNVRVEGRQCYLTFVRSENWGVIDKYAVEKGLDFPFVGGEILETATVEIDDSGADDQFYYPKSWKID